jgi:hypothetical protein
MGDNTLYDSENYSVDDLLDYQKFLTTTRSQGKLTQNWYPKDYRTLYDFAIQIAPDNAAGNNGAGLDINNYIITS